MFNATFAHRRWIGASILSISWLLLAGPAVISAVAAGVMVDSGGFESPYSVGPLQGQQSWQNAGSGTTSAVVQSSVVYSGSQAVLVTRTPNSDQRWAVPNLIGFPSQRYVTIDWNMRVSQPSITTAFGPFFGVDTYDDAGTFGQLGSFGVDATTGEVLYQLEDSGAIAAAPFVVQFDQWYRYRMILDFQTDTYQGYVNGTLTFTTGFVDRSFGLDNLSDADISAFAVAADPTSQGLSASAVFDNFLVYDGLLVNGDYDLDGDVDTADYDRWRASYGLVVNAASNNADGNRNGAVDAADYVLWRSAMGGGSGAALERVSVPEPPAMLILLLGLLITANTSGCRQHLAAVDKRV